MRAAWAIMMGLVCVVGALAAPGSVINGQVGFNWSYNTNNDPITGLSFNLYFSQSLSLPLGQWALLTNIAAVDALDPGTGNFHLEMTLPVRQYFFMATSSNFWGESSYTSNVLATPSAPQLINTLRIQKLP